MNIMINGKRVPVFGEYIELAVASHQFQDWLKSLDPRFIIRSIRFQSVDIVQHGSTPRVMFIKFRADVVDPEGNFVAGVVFMRGGSVAILIILECEGEKYAVLTLQPRFPTGHFGFPEVVAGTLEGDGSFAGGAARELEEETGIIIKEQDLIDLTALVYGDKFKGVYTTPGGSDEFLRLFLFRKVVDREYLAEIHGKCTGLACESERIVLKVIPLWRLPFEAPDAKALSAVALYEAAKRNLLIEHD